MNKIISVFLLGFLLFCAKPVMSNVLCSVSFSLQDSLGEDVRSYPFGANLFTGTHQSIDDLLDAIKIKYRGKTVILDLWGTFCKPCISDFKNSPKIKEELLGLDVHMVYLCAGKSSAPAKWTEIIQELELKGDHIYLDRTLTNSYMEKFGVRSYPSYVILDSDGDFHKNQISGVGDINLKSFKKRLKTL
jgi:thiol-disulfide isomerase/thioredoxin